MCGWVQRLCGPMDKAPAYGAGDCRFESCLSQFFFLDLKLIRVFLIMDAEKLICDRINLRRDRI